MQRAVVKIGGSLMIPKSGIDTNFLSSLNTFIRTHIQKGRSFYFVVGGGSTTRTYQEAAQKVIHNIPQDDVDWLGIHSTRLNAQLLRTVFKDIAHPRVIENYDHKLEDVSQPVIVASGWKPGHSTNACAIQLAIDYDVSTVLNLTNTAFVYDKDPHEHADAQPLKELSWSQYFELIPSEWTPGAHVPFDPIAARMAKEHAKTVIIADGTNFINTSAILDGQDFEGTVIS